MNEQYYIVPKKLIDDMEAKAMEINDLASELIDNYCVEVKGWPNPRLPPDFFDMPRRPQPNLDKIF